MMNRIILLAAVMGTSSPFLWTRGDLAGDCLGSKSASDLVGEGMIQPPASKGSTPLDSPGTAKADAIKNRDIAQRIRSGEIAFEPPAHLPAELRHRFVLGNCFFTSTSRTAFLKAQDKLETDELIQIGWYEPKNKRFVGPPFSRTRSDIEKMTDQEFDNYRATWNEHTERTMSRYFAPGRKLREATKVELANMRALRTSENREALLKRVAGEGAAYAVVAHLEKVGTGMHHYAIPLNEVRGLTEEEYQRWRQRFLLWIEVHTPGQSRVTWMARLTDEAFHRELIEHRRKFRSVTFQHEKWQARFFERWGFKIEKPSADKNGSARVIVSEIRSGSPAADIGLQPGDQISRVEGQVLREWQDLPFILQSFQPRTKLRMDINRGRKTQQVWITVP
jgi:hypothetical protein